MSIAELLAEERLKKANQALNESQSPQEMRIQDLEIQKQQCLEEMKEWMNDLGIREYQKEEIDIDYRRKCEDKIYELKDKFNGLSIEIWKIIQEAEELRAYVDDDDTDDDDDYDDDVYVDDCVDIEEDEGEIDLDISKIVDISLREKLVEKEADVPSFSDDSILRGIKSDRDSGEPVMAEVNIFDEINTSELSYPGIGENVVLDEEEDTFTFTTRSFLPFVTYPEVLPTSYSTESEDKVFKPGIFDNVLSRKSSLKIFDPPSIVLPFIRTNSLVWGGFHLLEFLHSYYYPP
ncbi:hypothetical protein Tco_1078677 [Tanacetum coccineum]|uniref:Uncharacterized protein n=1 Tax=Tanacetum coccineum TaxID=301880 RepID=A0ABQ5HRA6_9ASTR